MLTRFKSRRLAAVLALAGVTNAAGFLAAQAPTRGLPANGSGQNTTRLISNCDVTQQSCGGDPVLGGGGTSGGWAPEESEKPTCWTGTKTPCGRDSSRICLQYVGGSGTGSVTITGGASPGGSVSGSATGTCISYTVIIRNYFWSK